MGKSFFEIQKNRLRLFLILVTFLAASVILSANISASSLTKVYDTKITKVTTDDTGDWTIKGTTKAPSGTKVYATTAVKSDESYGTNSGSNLDQTTWSKVKNGKFTISVEPLTLSDSTSYKAGKKFKVYIFAAKGGIKSFIDSNSTKPLSNKSMQKVSKTATKRTLVLTKSQVKYLNSLDSNSSASSSSSSSDSSLSGEAKDLATGSWKAGTDFKAGYYKITSTGGSGNLTSDNGAVDVNAILGQSIDNDLGQVDSYTAFLTKGTTLNISGMQGVHIEPLSINSNTDLSNISAGDYLIGTSIPAGRYTVTAVQGSGNVMSDGGSVNEVMGTTPDTDLGQVTNTTVTLHKDEILSTSLEQISLTKQ